MWQPTQLVGEEKQKIFENLQKIIAAPDTTLDIFQKHLDECNLPENADLVENIVHHLITSADDEFLEFLLKQIPWRERYAEFMIRNGLTSTFKKFIKRFNDFNAERCFQAAIEFIEEDREKWYSVRWR